MEIITGVWIFVGKQRNVPYHSLLLEQSNVTQSNLLKERFAKGVFHKKPKEDNYWKYLYAVKNISHFGTTLFVSSYVMKPNSDRPENVLNEMVLWRLPVFPNITEI